ncbi:glycoside hydrolase family 38 C-terminal domain-containing protein [Clostridium paraputrificum]|uniref:glycoside hydrolase family 38 N-terminal domain-containing protein n=1 Tax=Clostridium paraputrificum TaxID=29363 RepID=UPI003D3381D9
MKKTIHTLAHTHWDREWYFTDSESRVLLSKAFDEVLDTLDEKEELLYYHLDAQSSLIESYLEQKPNQLARIQKLVKEGRLLIGPWYTQPDVFNIHAESIVRNLKYGIDYANKIGKCMKIAYLPDTFGFNAQMPQIVSGCGLDGIIVRRGYNPELHGKTEMIWESIDGTKSLTAVQAYGYSVSHPKKGGRNGNFSKENLEKETYPLIDNIKRLSNSEHIMCPVGGDQVAIDENFNEFVDKLNKYKYTEDEYIQSSIPNYMDTIRKEIGSLGTFVGEFRDPVYSRVHKTIGSSRYDIKKANHDAEQELIRVAEPISCIAENLGFWYDQTSLDRAWKFILQAHAHDSMGGCNSDETNEEILLRCRQAEQIAFSIFNIIAKNIALNIEEKVQYDTHFIIFNSTIDEVIATSEHTIATDSSEFLLYDINDNKIEYDILEQIKYRKPRKIVLTPEGEKEEMVDEYFYVTKIALDEVSVPALGYTTIYIKDSENSECKKEQLNFIENKLLKLEIRDSKLTLTDKIKNKEISDFMYFEDMADDGDLYDYSPLVGEEPIIINEAEVVKIANGNILSEMEILYKFNLPKEINEERTSRSEELVPQELRLTCRLWKNTDRVDFKVNFNNTVKDHRVRVLFKLDEVCNNVYADLPFGYISRETDRHPKLITQAEVPVNFEPLQNSIIAPLDKESYMAVMTKGLKEYQVIDKKILAITLFKGVGRLGKNDLLYRPGRASGREVASPQGQLMNELNFEFSMMRMNNEEGVPYLKVARTLESYLNPGFSYQKQVLKKDIQKLDYFDISIKSNKVEPQYGFINGKYLRDKGLIFSSLSYTINNEKLLRVFNPSDKDLEIDIRMVSNSNNVFVSNFIGERKSQITKCTVKRFQAVNIIIE